MLCIALKTAATAPTFNLPHLHLGLRWGWLHLSFAKIFGTRKHSSLFIVWRHLHDLTFGCFSRTPTCDGWTDRQTYDNSYCHAGKSLEKLLLLWYTNNWHQSQHEGSNASSLRSLVVHQESMIPMSDYCWSESLSSVHFSALTLSDGCQERHVCMYTVNQKKTWQFIFEYKFG